MDPRQQVSDAPASQSQQDREPVQIVQRVLQVGDILPARLTAKDMQRIFAISSSRFYALAKQGTFDTFELLPQIGPRAWSGERVLQYLKGQPVIARTFGRKVRG